MWIISTSNGPSSRLSPGGTSSSSMSLRRCSSSFERAIAIVRRPPKTGGGSSSSRSTNGSAPRWSPWPWVMTMPSMSSWRSRSQVKSGRTRSMPIMSAVGKRSPQSTTTMRPSYSTTVMFLPISPSPPRGRTRRVPLLTAESLRVGGFEQPVARQDLAHGAGLGLVGLDEREAQASDAVTEQVERGLDRDGVRGDVHDVVDVAQPVVDLTAAVGLVDHAAHLVADDVAGDADAAGLAEFQDVGEHVVVAGVDAEAVDR